VASALLPVWSEGRSAATDEAVARGQGLGRLHRRQGEAPLHEPRSSNTDAMGHRQICRLAFYRNDPPAALSFFHQHLNKFGELSVGWGIGKDTFEFWSWIGRQ
jgi:hypothetical protein